MELAKSSRMLGGNTGYFSGNRDCMLICMACKRFGSVWMAVGASQLDLAFNLTPEQEDINAALEFKNESEAQAYATQATAQWVENYQKPIAPEKEIPGGGLGISDAVLKSIMNWSGVYKRARAKPYLTKSEANALEADKLEQQKRRELEQEQKRRDAAAARAGK
eukprot:6202420-Pleurochrysis_carterae.AAC.1